MEVQEEPREHHERLEAGVGVLARAEAGEDGEDSAREVAGDGPAVSEDPPEHLQLRGDLTPGRGALQILRQEGGQRDTVELTEAPPSSYQPLLAASDSLHQSLVLCEALHRQQDLDQAGEDVPGRVFTQKCGLLLLVSDLNYTRLCYVSLMLLWFVVQQCLVSILAVLDGIADNSVNPRVQELNESFAEFSQLRQCLLVSCAANLVLSQSDDQLLHLEVSDGLTAGTSHQPCQDEDLLGGGGLAQPLEHEGLPGVRVQHVSHHYGTSPAPVPHHLLLVPGPNHKAAQHLLGVHDNVLLGVVEHHVHQLDGLHPRLPLPVLEVVVDAGVDLVLYPGGQCPAAQAGPLHPVRVVLGLTGEEVQLLLQPLVVHLVLLQPLGPGLSPESDRQR